MEVNGIAHVDVTVSNFKEGVAFYRRPPAVAVAADDTEPTAGGGSG